MKYVILGIVDQHYTMEMPIVFPDILVHSFVAEVFAVLLRRQFNKEVGVISAGTCTLGLNMHCSGESETLKVKSRGKQDAALILTYDYTKGIPGLAPEYLLQQMKAAKKQQTQKP